MISRCGEISLRQEEQLLGNKEESKLLGVCMAGVERGNWHEMQRISEVFIFFVKSKLRSFTNSGEGGVKKEDLRRMAVWNSCLKK